MLWLTMMMVSIVWAVSRAVNSNSTPTASPPDRPTALFNRIDPLPQPVRRVHRGVGPAGEVQRGVDTCGELGPAAAEHDAGATHRIRLERSAHAGHRGPRRDPRRQGPKPERRVSARAWG